MKNFDVLIIGGGPAGIMTAISASQNKDLKIALLEKNNQLGKKLLLTGKGRCNFTTSKSIPEIVDAFGNKGNFLYSCLTQFSNKRLITFFKRKRIKPKFERGDRVFPRSESAEKVRNTLVQELERENVQIFLKTNVKKIETKKEFFHIYTDSKQFRTKCLIIATGGKTYPGTGSTGDGYEFAKQLGHTITPLYPALNGLIVKDEKIRELAGLTLKNVRLQITADGQEEINVFGDMLFTHLGISGPIVLSISEKAACLIDKGKKVEAIIDLKPALERHKLKKRIVREIQEIGKKEYQTLLKNLLPSSLIPLTIVNTRIDKRKKVGSLTHEEQIKIVDFLKNFKFKIDDYEPFVKAIVTSGGVSVNEIDSKTMQSQIVSNLYFAGEIIELSGPTGGFNLQMAFSTGWVAGVSARCNLAA